jgi:hypothetical protein
MPINPSDHSIVEFLAKALRIGNIELFATLPPVLLQQQTLPI